MTKTVETWPRDKSLTLIRVSIVTSFNTRNKSREKNCDAATFQTFTGRTLRTVNLPPPPPQATPSAPLTAAYTNPTSSSFYLFIHPLSPFLRSPLPLSPPSTYSTLPPPLILTSSSLSFHEFLLLLLSLLLLLFLHLLLIPPSLPCFSTSPMFIPSFFRPPGSAICYLIKYKPLQIKNSNLAVYSLPVLHGHFS